MIAMNKRHNLSCFPYWLHKCIGNQVIIIIHVCIPVHQKCVILMWLSCDFIYTPNIHSVAVINHYSKHYWILKRELDKKVWKLSFVHLLLSNHNIKEPFWRFMSGDDDTKTKSDGETSEDKMDLGNSSDQEEYENKLDSSDPRKVIWLISF